MDKKVLHSGIGKLFVSELLTLIATLLISALDLFEKNSTLWNVFTLAAPVLLVVGGILNLIGLINLRNVNKNLKEAFWLTMAMIILTFVTSVLSLINPEIFPEDMFSLTQTVITILLVFAIIDGIREAVPEVDKLGKFALIVYAIFSIGGTVVNMINAESTAVTIIAVISMVCDIIYGISYIIFLGKANKATKE